MAIERKAKLSFDIEQELMDELKALAMRKGKTLREFCIDVLQRRVEIEKTGYLSAESAPLLAELWDNEEDAAYDDAS